MVRSVIPMISAASHHFNCPAMAFKITSWIFIIRSVSAAGICCSVSFTPPSFSHPLFKRTFHLLIEPDKSHAKNTLKNCTLRRKVLRDILLGTEESHDETCSRGRIRGALAGWLQY